MGRKLISTTASDERLVIKMRRDIPKRDQAILETERKFKKVFSMLKWLLNQVDLTERMAEFEVHGYKFLAKRLENTFEFGPANEEPTFPTVAYELMEDGKPNLLYYRAGTELLHDLNVAMGGAKADYYLQMAEDNRNHEC